MTTDRHPAVLVSTDQISRFGAEAAFVVGLIRQRSAAPWPDRIEHAGEFWWLATADDMVAIGGEDVRVGLQRGIDAGLITVEQFPTGSGTTPGYRVTEFPPVPPEWDRS